MRMNWSMWLYGLLVTVISGSADGGLLMLVAPEDFNLTTGLKPLLGVCAVFGIKAGLLYLKAHPLPEFGTTVVVTGDKATVNVEASKTDGTVTVETQVPKPEPPAKP